MNKGFADLKSSYLYENLLVQIKRAIMSRRLYILLAILLYEQFIHHTQIYLRPNKQLLALSSILISHFELHPALNPFASMWHVG